ncbi:MAG TPA: proton-conducting transporter membrane subunit, partial [Chitinophagales bacterium]|nr:proton-conducting transporter membrane subunit [Chitinophagales bacterium]
AGIYLIARCNILFSSAEITMSVIAIIGVATSLLAAIIAVFQNDIKKVLAYSTVSQLGLIFLALGVGAYTAGVFHVLTHAFFKALLFLGAGSVIHGMSGEQDIRKMGGLKSKMPITHITFLIATIAIAGIPPLAGFFSKDQILASTFVSSKILFGLGLFASLLTSFYMFRLYFLTFHGEFRGTEEQEHHLHESPKSMTFPLIILAVLSVIAGFIGFPHALGDAIGVPNIFDHFLEETVAPLHAEISLNTELALMGATTVLILITIFIAKVLFIDKKNIPLSDEEPMSLSKEIVYHKFYVDEIYQVFVVKSLYGISAFINKIVEQFALKNIVDGVGKVVVGLGSVLRYSQVGTISLYIVFMVFAIALFVMYKFYFLIFHQF